MLSRTLASNNLGPTVIDEGIKLASMITAGNDKSMLVVLEPQHHGSMDKHTIVKHRRVLEDKIIACLVCACCPTCVPITVVCGLLFVVRFCARVCAPMPKDHGLLGIQHQFSG